MKRLIEITNMKTKEKTTQPCTFFALSEVSDILNEGWTHKPWAMETIMITLLTDGEIFFNLIKIEYRLEQEKNEAISNAVYCQRCMLLPGDSSPCYYDKQKCDNLRKQYDDRITSLEKERDLKIAEAWPSWSSHPPSLTAPELELFNKKDEIKTTDDLYTIEAFSKLGGGYLIKFIDTDIEFEVIALADGTYYLKK